MEKQNKNISINILRSIMSGIVWIIFILAIFSSIGDPDLLDQFIAIAKNYSETIKCK